MVQPEWPARSRLSPAPPSDCPYKDDREVGSPRKYRGVTLSEVITKRLMVDRKGLDLYVTCTSAYFLVAAREEPKKSRASYLLPLALRVEGGAPAEGYRFYGVRLTIEGGYPGALPQ